MSDTDKEVGFQTWASVMEAKMGNPLTDFERTLIREGWHAHLALSASASAPAPAPAPAARVAAQIHVGKSSAVQLCPLSSGRADWLRTLPPGIYDLVLVKDIEPAAPADETMSTDEQPLRAALAELVALRDLKTFAAVYPAGNETALRDHARRHLPAWEAARAALATPAVLLAIREPVNPHKRARKWLPGYWIEHIEGDGWNRV